MQAAIWRKIKDRLKFDLIPRSNHKLFVDLFLEFKQEGKLLYKYPFCSYLILLTSHQSNSLIDTILLLLIKVTIESHYAKVV
jgi:hypothetical protein